MRIGILNLLNQRAITDIVTRFAAALNDMGAGIDTGPVLEGLQRHYDTAVAAE